MRPPPGSGISPFLPITTPTSAYTTILGVVLFSFRIPIFLTFCTVYFLVLDYLPLPQFARKLFLWTILGIPGIWWVDLQLDGVKRGSLSQQPASRFPREHAVIAAQFTSPIDAVYLAAIFDPIFVVSYPGTRKVKRVSLFSAVALALSPPKTSTPANPSQLTTLRALVEQNPRRVIAVFPEMTTTNGKGILPLSPSLLSCAADTKIFPVSMRYTPANVTTPVPGPGAWISFLWNLLSKPTHYIRVRVAEGVSNTSVATNGLSDAVTDEKARDVSGDGSEDLTLEERRLIDHVSDALARLARNKRVALTLKDKAAFVDMWTKGKK
jgi:1-acylglycerol-3-phosphate O-acyltransferase